MKKITIGIPTNRGIKGKTAKCLLELVSRGEHDFHIVVADEGFTTAQNRIYIAMQALKNKSDWVFMVDDDMTFGASILDDLLATEKEIIGVNSYSRVFPLSTTVALMDEQGNYKDPSKHPAWELKVPYDVFECFAIGTGIILIKTEVFEKIKKPWFKFDMHEDGYMIEGEDAWFCSQAKKKGYKIWCDGTQEIGHVGETVYGDEIDTRLKAIYNKPQ